MSSLAAGDCLCAARVEADNKMSLAVAVLMCVLCRYFLVKVCVVSAMNL